MRAANIAKRWRRLTPVATVVACVSNLKQRHADVHDINVRWHSCNMCEQRFKDAGELKRHRANVHNINAQWHPCNMCEWKFKEAGTLTRHRACVHNIDVRCCDQCDQKFKLRCHLKVHRANVHGINVRWHSCNVCEQKHKKSMDSEDASLSCTQH